ncbi:MAG: hypothetical protein GY844_14995 [Bradyrhizobium sp.]|nr:hypothetical protein [Bradyrhizobium sp.]
MQQTNEQFLTDIERELRAEMRSRPRANDPRSYNAPTVASPATMPEYVEHSDAATEIGKLSAEAVVGEYEAAAKEIEAMGADLLDRVRQCEAVTAGALSVTDELKEVAARYRIEAKRIFDQIESCSSAVADVRRTCIELRDKLAAPASVEKQKTK